MSPMPFRPTPPGSLQCKYCAHPVTITNVPASGDFEKGADARTCRNCDRRDLWPSARS